MIIVFASGKGGTTKTTNAVQMAYSSAAKGRKVLLVDMDKQASAILWLEQRTKNAPEAVKIHGMAQLGKGAADRVKDFVADYDDIVIDTRGAEALNREMREALLIADKVITPIKPSLFDSATMFDMAEAIDGAQALNPGLKAFMLLADCSTHPLNTKASTIRDELADLPAYSGFLQTEIPHREVYSLVAERGQSVVEFATGKRMAPVRAEMGQLAEEVWQ